MKYFSGWLLSVSLFLLTATVFGQSGLTVVKHEFKPGEMPRLDSSNDISAASDSALPRADSMSTVQATTPRRGTAPSILDSSTPNDSNDTPMGGQRFLQIAVELRNSTGRKIVGVDLDCILLEKDEKEYLRYRLVSEKALKSGETGKIKKTLIAKNLPKEASSAKVFGMVPLGTKVEIVAVRFDDGTVWTAPK